MVDRWGWPGPVAILGGPFFHRFRLGLLCPSEGVLVIFQRSQDGRPDLSRPACFSFGICLNFSGILCSFFSFGFCCAVVKHESRGVVGTHMCTNHINTKREELETLIYSNRNGGYC